MYTYILLLYPQITRHFLVICCTFFNTKTLDGYLPLHLGVSQDPDSKVACETCTKTNMVMVFGEITTKANVNYEKIVRDTCRGIGFTSADVGLDADNCKVLVNIEQQSPDIAQGVHGHLTKKPEEIGAGDQGHMFGYATDETPELMPLTHVLATKLGAKLTEVRKNMTCPWLRPDGKTQVTIEYKNDGGAMVPIRVHTVLISTQHDETVTNDQIAKDLKEHANCLIPNHCAFALLPNCLVKLLHSVLEHGHILDFGKLA
ncbi:unnamed protein product [Fraxinus pennsylvanica]|uniref:methionine adenosyltransferase n=1 Tax=Fraxinus pennsylvanica TaxID=56036 RepID=A0AAD1ZBC0_9LAMI|nr:unnamed protein product [Fraxinus pennsylvanica]